MNSLSSHCLLFRKYFINVKYYVSMCYMCLIMCAVSGSLPVLSSELNVSTSSSLLLLSPTSGATKSVTTENSTTINSNQKRNAGEQLLMPSPTLQPPLQKLDFVTSQVDETETIQGWQCYCWNSTIGSEV